MLDGGKECIGDVFVDRVNDPAATKEFAVERSPPPSPRSKRRSPALVKEELRKQTLSRCARGISGR